MQCSLDTNYPHVSLLWREAAPQMASSPQILRSSTDRHRQTPKLCKKPLSAVHHRSACSGVKACPWLEQGALRNTSAAKRQAAKPWLAFRSLDPFRALREPDHRRLDEERPFRSQQRTGNKPKRLLDRKSPIQVVQTIGSSARRDALTPRQAHGVKATGREKPRDLTSR